MNTARNYSTFRAVSFWCNYVCHRNSKHMMLRNILLLSFLFQSTMLLAQDSLEVKPPKKPSNFALGFGLSYSVMGFESRPYFIDSTGKVGNCEIKNVVGVSASVGYNFRINPRWMIRPLVEAHMMPAKIIYDTEIDHRTESRVYPISLEFPIAAVFNLTSKPMSPTAQVAVRPAYAPEAYSDKRPLIEPFNFQMDFGIGMPIKVHKATIRTELYYSHGFMELIGEDPDDYKTRSVKHLTRSFVGIRFYFS